MLNVKKDGYRKMLTIVGILLLFSEISERNVAYLKKKKKIFSVSSAAWDSTC